MPADRSGFLFAVARTTERLHETEGDATSKGSIVVISPHQSPQIGYKAPAADISPPSISLDSGAETGSGARTVEQSSTTDYESLKPWTVRTADAVTDVYDISTKLLGSGTYSQVFAATHRELKGTFAVKCINKAFLVSPEEKESIRREVEVHLRCHHPNIVRLFEVYEDSSSLWLVMEQTNHGTLKNWMARHRRSGEHMASKLVHQLLIAVAHLHQMGILHSDIKPENILVNTDTMSASTGVAAEETVIKICDFGLARKVPDIKYFRFTRDVYKVPFTGVCGTPGYIAPELLMRQPYGTPTDMWSVGVIMFELIGGYPPFRPYSKCLKMQVSFQGRAWKCCSAEAMDLLQKLLVVQPSRRLSATDALKHPWFDRFGLLYQSG